LRPCRLPHRTWQGKATDRFGWALLQNRCHIGVTPTFSGTCFRLGGAQMGRRAFLPGRIRSRPCVLFMLSPPSAAACPLPARRRPVVEDGDAIVPADAPPA
jgi:hypothetical protein